MKAKLETIPVKGKGVEIESETEEERAVLENIFNNHGGPAMLTRKDHGMVQLVVAPDPQRSIGPRGQVETKRRR